MTPKAKPRKFYGVPADKIPLGPPETMIDAIEAESENQNDPYWARVNTLMARKHYDLDGSDDARLLRQTRGGLVLDEMSRSAGFVLGFEFAEWLRSGGKTKGGAR